MKIKKNTLYAVIILLVLVIGGYFVMSKDQVVGGNTGAGEGETQKVVLSIKNGNYYPQEIRVKANQPVEISLDSSVAGCYRSFTIRDLGVAKYLATPQDSVAFTPTKTGTYVFACSMGMGTGKLVVE